MTEVAALVTGAMPVVLSELQETLRNQGSVAPVAYVLADSGGDRMLMVSLASRSESNKQLSIANVREAAAAYPAVAVVWAEEGWLTDSVGRQPGIFVEVQMAHGAWYRLGVPVTEDEDGAATFDAAVAVTRLAPYAGPPLFARAF